MLEALLTIGIPIIGAVILTLLRSVASRKPIDLEASQDIALDLTFLAIGAAGGAVHSRGIVQRLGGNAVTLVVILIFIDLLIAAVLLYRRSFGTTMTKRRAFVDLSLGSATLALISVVTVLGTRWEVK